MKLRCFSIVKFTTLTVDRGRQLAAHIPPQKTKQCLEQTVLEKITTDALCQSYVRSRLGQGHGNNLKSWNFGWTNSKSRVHYGDAHAERVGLGCLGNKQVSSFRTCDDLVLLFSSYADKKWTLHRMLTKLVYVRKQWGGGEHDPS